MLDILDSFTCRGDLIEHLYEIKELFEEKIHTVTDSYLTDCFNFIEKLVPKSKYFDAIVLELADDVLETIFNKYISIAMTKMPKSNSTFFDVNSKGEFIVYN